MESVQELYARYRETALPSFTPGILNFTTCSYIGIKEIRYVPGGRILDEPAVLLTDRFDE